LLEAKCKASSGQWKAKMEGYRTRWLKAAADVVPDLPPFEVLELAVTQGELLQRSDKHQIQMDLHRSQVPGLAIEDAERAAHLEALERILHAWCALRPELGYVQGMNFTAAVMLAVCNNVAESFTLFTALITRLPAYFYDEALSGFQVEVEALLLLLEDKSTLLDGDGGQFLRMALPTVLCEWYLKLWVGCLPLRCLLQLWDLMLTGDVDKDGATCVTLNVSLALLTRAEAVEQIVEAERHAALNKDPSAVHIALLRSIQLAESDQLLDAIKAQPVRPAQIRTVRLLARRRLKISSRTRTQPDLCQLAFVQGGSQRQMLIPTRQPTASVIGGLAVPPTAAAVVGIAVALAALL